MERFRPHLPIIGAAIGLVGALAATVLVWVVEGPNLALGVLVFALVVHLTVTAILLRRHGRRVLRILRRLQARFDRLEPAIERMIQRGRRLAAEPVAAPPADPADVSEVDERQGVASTVEAIAVARADFTLPRPEQRPPSVRLEDEEVLETLRSTDLFDADWYVEQHPSAADDPARYYLEVGVAAGHDPHPLLYADWYLLRYPEARAWPSPVHHHLAEGERLGLDPHPLFRSRWYADRYIDGRSEFPPILHYVREGVDEDLDTHPLFAGGWFRRRYLAGRPETLPLRHFVVNGPSQSLDPNPHITMAELLRRLGTPNGRDPLTAFLARWTWSATRPAAVPVGPPTGRADALGQAQWEYLLSGTWDEPDSFILYRIIGNDLPPRHRIGQTRENVRFILENEPDLEGCEKRWVVNRISDPEEEARVLTLLEEFDAPYLRIPFELDALTRFGWRFDDFPEPGVTFGDVLSKLPDWAQPIAQDHLYHDKNRYVMNNNGARNAALEDGIDRATWILPWDGNCFLTAEAWEEIRAAVHRDRYLKYGIVPMARVTDNASLKYPGFRPPAEEEPQILFRRDASERFDDDARYGRRPKVRLFYRLAYRGPWDRWKDLEWEQVDRRPGSDAWKYFEAGWVARLFSGQRELESDIKGRGQSRMQAIRTHIDALEEQAARQVFSRDDLFALHEPTFEKQRTQPEASSVKALHSELVAVAEDLIELDPPSVLDKLEQAPSGDPQDYWHPAPYWWPDPKKRDGRPFVRRDGQRRPGTELGTPGSERYDRSALQQVLDGGYLLGLAWYLTGDERYAKHGANLVRRWFIDPATRMNPHLRYAQVRPGHDGDEGQASGIIEMSDLYYLLDGVRLLERARCLSNEEVQQLRSWLAAYDHWLQTSRQGREELASRNNHGLWYDVQRAAIAAYLDDVPGLLATLRRADERQRVHFAKDGSQPHELARTMPRHYTAYNLQGWCVLAHLADRVGYRLWERAARDGKGMERACRWLLPYLELSWTGEQEEGFDDDRLDVLAHHVRAGYPTLLQDLGLAPVAATELRTRFSPHDGIRPFWQLGLATETS